MLGWATVRWAVDTQRAGPRALRAVSVCAAKVTWLFPCRGTDCAGFLWRQFGTVTNMFSNNAYAQASQSAAVSPVGFAGAGGITRYVRDPCSRGQAWSSGVSAGRRPLAVTQSVACRHSAHGAHGSLSASSQWPTKHSGRFRRSLRGARAIGRNGCRGGETPGETPAWSAALNADTVACMVQIPDSFCPPVRSFPSFVVCWFVSFHSATNINAMGLMSS